MNIFWFLVIGVAAGWIAGRLVEGGNKGLLGNLLIGAIGSVIGGHVFVYLDVSAGSGHMGAFVTSVVGAVLLLWVVHVLKK